MPKARLEAFSDAVIAIILTIMVLELEVPHDPTWSALRGLTPKFLTYVLSFAYLGIYWNNHHHMLQTIERVNGAMLWANLHLLFWLSLTPFVTGWMGENDFASGPVVAYGVVLLMAAIAYLILLRVILAAHGPTHVLRAAVGKDVKGKISPTLYAAGVALAFPARWLSVALYVFVALMWLVPDKRIESIYRDQS